MQAAKHSSIGGGRSTLSVRCCASRPTENGKATTKRIRVNRQSHVPLDLDNLWQSMKRSSSNWEEVKPVLAALECVYRFEFQLEGERVLDALHEANEACTIRDPEPVFEKNEVWDFLLKVGGIEADVEPPIDSLEKLALRMRASTADQEFIEGFVRLMRKAQFFPLDSRDVALSKSLNMDYLSQLFIRGDTRKLDAGLTSKFMSEELPPEARDMLIFQRGYGTQKEAGRWLLPKLDYIQLLIVKSTVAAVTKAFKKACVGIKNSGAKIDSYLSSESDQPEKKGTALNPLDDSGRPIINTETWKLIKGAGKDVIVSMNELGIPPKVMTLGGGVLLTLVDRGYIPQIDVTSLETFDEVWPIEDGNAAREPLFVERFTLTDAVGSAFASGNVADFFSRAELKEPTFERLVVVYRYNKKPGRIDALKKIFSESQPDAPQPTPREEIQIRVYDGIPMPIWKAVFPEKLLQFRPLDNIRLDLVTLIGLVAVGAQAKYDSVLLEIATFASVVVYLVRVFLGYKRMFDRFDSFVNELLSRKTLAGQEGAIVYLASSAALQQFKHCALAYSLMICRNKALSTKALGNEVEKMLREEGLQVRFESQDALSQLLRLGLVSITRIGAEDFYTAVDPKIGIKRITKHWDDLLKGKIAERY
ncbi:hypothetical protein BSKO_10049 [Bryopsis sp. KO-2023]|nr:hypothetical protein BSKO_10049 [Bryopsis sp. KO-2023]